MGINVFQFILPSLFELQVKGHIQIKLKWQVVSQIFKFE